MRAHSSSVARLTDAVARAQFHWQTRSKEAAAGDISPPRAAGFTIALEREAGALGTTVGHALGEHLGWPVYDHELLERIAQETGLRLSLLESIDERLRNWLGEALEQFAAVPSISESTYLRHVLQTILSLGAHGECVIVGRGATQVLPAETTLRVLLVGSLEDRIAVLGRKFGLSREEAGRKAREIERERAALIREHFQKEVGDPRHYDLVLNCSSWSVAQCVALIVEGLRQRTPAVLVSKAQSARSGGAD